MTTFSAGCDGQVRMWNPSQGPNAVQIIGKHDQPVRLDVFYFIHKLLLIFCCNDLSTMMLFYCDYFCMINFVRFENYFVSIFTPSVFFDVEK